MMNRSLLAKMMLAGVLFMTAGMAYAQSYPNKPVRWILPYAPGGATEIIARIVAQRMMEILGQQIVIESHGGGASVVGTNMVARAAPDGYTMLLGSFGFAITPSLQDNLPYDSIRDFSPVGLIGNGSLALVVRPSLPVRSVKELIALAKAKPKQLNFGSTGGGSSSSLGALLFNSMTGVEMTGIAYKGAGPSTIALLGGEIDLIFSSILPALPNIKAGKFRVLGVSTPKRSNILPDIPTIAEAGVPGYELVSWYGILVPAKTPESIIIRLNQAVSLAVQTREVQEKLVGQGVDPATSTPAELGQYIKTEIAKWSKLVKEAGIQQD